MASFVFTPEATVEIVPRQDSPDQQHGPLAPAIASDLRPATFEDLERVYKFLDQASEREWHLPTSVIQGITGSRPKGRLWKRYGFEFVPATKHGLETAWAVQKASWDFTL